MGQSNVGTPLSISQYALITEGKSTFINTLLNMFDGSDSRTTASFHPGTTISSIGVSS